MDSLSPDSFAQSDQEAAEHGRTRTRDSLFLMARMTLPDAEAGADVRIRNLSEGGLMAEVEKPLPNGTLLRFDIRGIGQVDGKVVWCAEGRIGVALDERIDPKLARKPVGKPAIRR